MQTRPREIKVYIQGTEAELGLWEFISTQVEAELKFHNPRKVKAFRACHLLPRDYQLNQWDAASILGVSDSTVCRWCNEIWNALRERFENKGILEKQEE